MLLIAFITVAALAYSVAFGSTSVAHFLRIVAGAVLIEFLGTGVVIATALRSAMCSIFTG